MLKHFFQSVCVVGLVVNQNIPQTALQGGDTYSTHILAGNSAKLPQEYTISINGITHCIQVYSHQKQNLLVRWNWSSIWNLLDRRYETEIGLTHCHLLHLTELFWGHTLPWQWRANAYCLCERYKFGFTFPGTLPWFSVVLHIRKAARMSNYWMSSGPVLWLSQVADHRHKDKCTQFQQHRKVSDCWITNWPLLYSECLPYVVLAYLLGL